MPWRSWTTGFSRPGSRGVSGKKNMPVSRLKSRDVSGKKNMPASRLRSRDVSGKQNVPASRKQNVRVYWQRSSSVSARLIITTAASEYRSGPSAYSVGENISASSCSLKPNRYIPSNTARKPASTI